MNKLELLIPVVVLVGLSISKWRWSVQFALVFTVFEGALRKWAFPGLSAYIYFVKDFVLLGAYIGYFGSDAKKTRGCSFGLGVCLALGCGAVLLQALNPNLGSIVNGLFGAKAYLWYVPLIWVLPGVFRDKTELLRFTWLFIILAVPLGILAALQFNSPLDSLLNVYAAETDYIASFGEDSAHAQVTATFSYVGGYTTFLMFTFCLLIPNIFGSRKPVFVWANAAVMGLLLGNMCMSGGRKNFVFLGMCLVVLSFVVLTNQHLLNGAMKFLLIGSLTAGLAATYFAPAFEAILNRTRGNDDMEERTKLFLPLLQNLTTVGLAGYGAGASLATRSGLSSKLNVAPVKEEPPYMDFEPNQILFELGAVGFIAWYSLRIALLVSLWTTSQRMRDPYLKVLAATAFTFHLAHLYLGTYLNHIANIYLWFMAGFILLLPKLDTTAVIPNLAASKANHRSRRRHGRPPLPQASVNRKRIGPLSGPDSSTI